MVTTGLTILDGKRCTELGIARVSDADAGAAGERLQETFGETMPMGTLWPGETWSVNGELLQGKQLVALGPTLNPGEELESQVHWYWNPAEPEQLWISPSETTAPLLWLALPQDQSAIAAALASIQPQQGAFTRQLRAWMGWQSTTQLPHVYSGEWVDADIHTLTNYWLFNPYRGGTTMSSYSRFTRSHANFELHNGDAYVWSLAYHPAPHQTVVQRVNQAIGWEAYPLDLPLDLLGCLIGFDFITDAMLREEIAAVNAQPGDDEEQAQLTGDLLVMLSALCYRDADFASTLLDYAASPRTLVRHAVGHISLLYGLQPILDRLKQTEQDPDVLAYLAENPNVSADAPYVIENPLG